LHIRDALDAVGARHAGLLDKFGGHAMAAGMSLPRENFSAFATAFDAEVRRQLRPEDMAALILSDGELQAQEFDLALVEQLRAAGPWGDRKSTRLNSSHVKISYAVFFSKKKKVTFRTSTTPHR